MIPNSLLIANRGEIAIRIIRAAAEMGIRTVAVFPDDDATSLHTRKGRRGAPSKRRGRGAYLDGEQIIALAKEAGCDAIHPGYGFLSENAGFARRCAEAGITFVGPRAEMLELFGDKVQARALAARCGVPIMRGTSAATSLDEARKLFLIARRRRFDDDQSGRRRRRPRDARGVARSKRSRRPTSAASRRRARRSAMATFTSSS